MKINQKLINIKNYYYIQDNILKNIKKIFLDINNINIIKKNIDIK